MSLKENDIWYEHQRELEEEKRELEEQENYKGEDCVIGSPEKHTPQEWSQIMANLRL